MKLLSGECHSTSPSLNQHWFRSWLGAVRQQAITWADVDLDPRRHMTFLGHNELSMCGGKYKAIFIALLIPETVICLKYHHEKKVWNLYQVNNCNSQQCSNVCLSMWCRGSYKNYSMSSPYYRRTTQGVESGWVAFHSNACVCTRTTIKGLIQADKL